MPNKGYVVEPEILHHLVDDLDKCKIAWRIVTAPEGLGESPRPILVSSEVKPEGWTRYRRCRVCSKPFGLMANGCCVQGNCASCSQDRREIMTAEKVWTVIETGTMAHDLRLPALFTGVGVRTVADVRNHLAERSLDSVGPEREPIVAQALAQWRQRVIDALTEK